MDITHQLKNKDIDFSKYFSFHSADEILSYKNVNGESLSIGIYFPKAFKRCKKYPIFIFIHGGGWASRKIFPDQSKWAGDYLGYLARYYAEKGFVCASIDYRLMRGNGQTEGYQLTDLYDDCLDGVKFLIEKQEEYCLDFSRSVLLGESAGGYLAGALATYDISVGLPIQRYILVNAILDLSDEVWRTRIAENSSWLSLKDKTIEEKVGILSPIENVSNQTKPCLLLHGTRDTSVAPFHSQRFYEKMLTFGRRVTLDWIKDTAHAFLLGEYILDKGNSLSATQKAIHIIDEFINDFYEFI